MRSKVKSTVSGLAVVATFVFGSALFGEPLQATDARQAPSAVTADAPATSLALEGLEGVGAVTAEARAGNRRRLHLTMPYVALGRLLPRTGES